ncbi:11707_t:CDS:2 [Ambispora gerdemannii]|uniref:11707_t:CDS:1 n=1 Tax=Ambispora gerdemannii TaxID=144530 RepID=A0A9N9C664_9GLOM|nr:11707_t:CDS:2 [Ambispora gerdemannii]
MNEKGIRYLDTSNRDLAGNADLKKFTTLTSLNSYNNKFENLDFLNSLPNKDKLQKINFFGNQIKEIDLAHLLSTFLNCEKNPLSAKNLDNLTSEQFGKLVQGIKDKKIRINSFKGTILIDLLEYAQQLVTNGNNQQQQNVQYLQTLIQQGSSPVKDDKQPSNNTPLLVGGLVIFGIATLAIGYL